NTNGTTAAVSNVRFTSRSIEAQVTASAPTLVVIAQSFYPAWHATVDGDRVPLLRANVAFQAVPVPAGEHRLRLVYSDRAFHLGGAISGGTVLACLFFWWRFGRRSREA
ncbi:MAG TPA: YfhO family protein, partial [Methylomirabilota bacterium]|nr:YfhO family protein [Methylomirabilota bacterium]